MKKKEKKVKLSEYFSDFEENVVCHSPRPCVCLSQYDDQGACVIFFPNRYVCFRNVSHEWCLNMGCV